MRYSLEIREPKAMLTIGLRSEKCALDVSKSDTQQPLEQSIVVSVAVEY